MPEITVSYPTSMPYFSEHRTCKKCGQRPMAIGTKHITTITGMSVIRRNCGRCGYTWDEKPLDA